MQIGSLVETVADFTEERNTYRLPYPNKGDMLVVSDMKDHNNAECRKHGIVLLFFEEIPNMIGICDKQMDGTPNFIELMPPIEADYHEPEVKTQRAPRRLQTV
jgi:hypothetical protein